MIFSPQTPAAGDPRAGAPRVRFRDLFTPPYHRARLVGLFLAVLELIKRGELWLEQADGFGEIWLAAAPAGDGGCGPVS